jgi:hypothetical protein
MSAEQQSIYPAHLKERQVPLEQARVLTAQDFIELHAPLNHDEYLRDVEPILNGLSEEKRTLIDRAYVDRVRELWELTVQKQDPDSWVQFSEKIMGDYKSSVWVRDKETNDVARILDKESFFTVFKSRLFPLLSRYEIGQMDQGTVIAFGASTASPILAQLTQLGLGKAIVIDPDTINESNRTRMYAATVMDVGKNKAAHIGRHMALLNPFIDLEIHQRILNDDEMEDVIQQGNVVLEMVDNPPVKMKIREIALRHGKQVVMGTGIGNNPAVTVGELDFSIPSVAEDAPLKEQFDRVRGLFSIMGKDNISLRHKANFILWAMGRIPYWSQEPLTTAATASITGIVLKDIICGFGSKREAVINLDRVRSSSGIEESDSILLEEFKSTYPDVFLDEDETLDAAVERLMNYYHL